MAQTSTLSFWESQINNSQFPLKFVGKGSPGFLRTDLICLNSGVLTSPLPRANMGLTVHGELEAEGSKDLNGLPSAHRASHRGLGS